MQEQNVKYEQLKSLMQAFSEPHRGIIWHYTSAEGGAGIIGKHEIWMSNTAFMNDPAELYVKIIPTLGEAYAYTVEEAEKNGFRRALHQVKV